MGVQAFAGSEETVWTVLAHEYEVYLECDGKRKMNQKNDNCFDLLRCLAAFSVMYLHFTGYALIYTESAPAFINGLRTVATFMPGVVVLFSLSGFLIAGSLERTKSLHDFFVKRIFRLYPELWVCTLINFLIVLIVAGEMLDMSIIAWLITQIFGIANTPTCLQGFATGSVNGALWTIFTEIQLYIAIALSFKVVKKLSVKGWIVLLILLLLLNVGADGIVSYSPNSTVNKMIERLFLPYALWFYIGVFCKLKQDLIVPLLKKCIVFILGFYLVARYSSLDIPGYYCNVIIGVLCPLAVIGLAYSLPPRRFKTDITYGLFLYHWIFINLFINYKLFSNMPIILVTIVYTLLSIGIAWLSSIIVGKWSRQLSMKLIEKRKVVSS